MITNLSIKRKLLVYSFLIQIIILGIFSFSLYKALEISTLDKLQSNLKVIILDVTDDILEEEFIEKKNLDENKEYNFEPLYIRVLDSTNFQNIIQTSNFPEEISINNKVISSLKERTISFQEEDEYLISNIKINFRNKQNIIIQVATNKDVLNSTLENILYILTFILPIVLIFALLGGNFLIYKSFLPIEEILFKLKNINASELSTRLKTMNNKDEINQLASEINNLLERLEFSFERISQFSADASHELKTPLTIVKGELEIALRKDRSIKEYKETLKTSLEEVLVIEQSINDLLFLAKNEKDLTSINIENIYFDEIIDESINEVKNFAKLNNIRINFILEDTVEYKGYSNLLKIALKNILKNSIQFSHNNSEVIVKSYKNSSFFMISVQDFGIGIAKNEQNKIFEKFYRTDKSRNKNSGGTGLGMSILKKIVDIHKGKIQIQSDENIGTTITISFPIINNF